MIPKTLSQAQSYLARYLNREETKCIILKSIGRDLNDRLYLATNDRDLTLDEQQILKQLFLKRFKDRIPLAYLLGETQFYGYDLAIDQRALIPRPETELLVEHGLEFMKDRKNPRVLDLGTGSGAVALAFQKERPDAQVIASDSSIDALKLAQKNHRDLPILHLQSDWLQSFQKNTFDLILCNPPYIDYEELSYMNIETSYEPFNALFAGNAGLQAYQNIIPCALSYLKQDGWLGIEHGFQQAKALLTYFEAVKFERVMTFADYQGHDRLIFAQKG